MQQSVHGDAESPKKLFTWSIMSFAISLAFDGPSRILVSSRKAFISSRKSACERRRFMPDPIPNPDPIPDPDPGIIKAFVGMVQQPWARYAFFTSIHVSMDPALSM